MSNTTVNTTVEVNPNIVNEIKFEELREPLQALVNAARDQSGAILIGAAVTADAAKKADADRDAERQDWKDVLFVVAAIATVLSTIWVMRQ